MIMLVLLAVLLLHLLVVTILIVAQQCMKRLAVLRFGKRKVVHTSEAKIHRKKKKQFLSVSNKTFHVGGGGD